MSALEARIAEVLVDHQRMSSAACLCGWAELGKSHPEHQAAALAPVIREAQAEAWDECVHVYDSMVCLDCEPKAPANPYRTA